MRKLAIMLALSAVLIGCQSNETKSSNTSEITNPNIHKGIALEKLNATKYTYLLVNENGIEKWLAFPLAEVKVGETYYYENEMVMANFVSKDLGRTFPQVSFVQAVYTTPPVATEGQNANQNPQPMNQNPQPMMQEQQAQHQGSASIVTEKAEIKVEAPKGGTSLAKLMENKDKLSGKTVIVKGKVVKFSPDIMGRNWAHIQDGTDFNGKFDLTVSTQENLSIGEVVTLEGKVILNKDFGAGYVYEILLEDAKLK